MPQNKTALQRRLLLALRDAGITVLILLLTTLLCMLLDEVGEASSYASLLYVLSVLVISRLTNGYLFGILASIAAMFGVNYHRGLSAHFPLFFDRFHSDLRHDDAHQAGRAAPH